jgi:lipopolysaccharide transport system ATP-binding protein
MSYEDSPASGSSPAPAIELLGVSKRYPVKVHPSRLLWDALLGKQRLVNAQDFTALHPTDLVIQKGEVVGLVGRNGAGKSSLLHLVAGTSTSNDGRVVVKGRISAILELGAAFNAEFTGLENIHLALTAVGYKRTEILQLIDEIINFSGVSAFIDQPVKNYSSGMQVRLAFAVATCTRPDVLIVDEALSVGDGQFARKSFDRILQLKEAGTTILFCSHSLFQIEAICNRAVWIEAGRIVADGNPQTVVRAYQDFLDGAALEIALSSINPTHTKSKDAIAPAISTPANTIIKDRHATSMRFRSLAFEKIKFGKMSQNTLPDPLAKIGGELTLDSCQDSLKIHFEVDARTSQPTPHIALSFQTLDGRIIASTGTWIDGIDLKRNSLGMLQATLAFPKIALLKGTYSISAYLFCERGMHIYESADNIFRIHVQQDHLEQGLFRLERNWTT